LKNTTALDEAARLLGELARRDEPLGARTTYRVGGRAALLVEAGDRHALRRVATAVVASGIEVLLLGKGSNLLVADEGYPGLVVTLVGEFEHLEDDLDRALAHAGGALAYPVLARRLAARGLGGMSWAVGIPGSVGGAVAMNAGGHGSVTAERLVSVRLLDLASGEEREASVGELGLAYRHSALQASEVVLEATFALERRPRAELEAEIDEIVAWRRANQPGGRNAGSVFANPSDDAAGRLLEAAGAKGLRIGSAELSTKHANFINVDQDGSANDVAAVIAAARALVAERCGVSLELELHLVGFGR
jgi:UDP-N-acetylmuramate dehydrogenase